MLDRDLALDFDRVHNLRLTLFEAEKAKREADAIRGETEPTMPSLFRSNETGAFS